MKEIMSFPALLRIMSIVHGRGGGKYFRGGRKKSDFWEILGEREGGLGQERRKKGVKFWTCRAEKRSKIAQTTHLDLFFCLFTYLLRFSWFLPFFGHFR
jgi:hypothetical protein